MNRNQSEEQSREERNPEYNPSKAMDSKQEVENANDEMIDQDFPGYPHYPSSEDVMDESSDMHREDIDVENLPNRNSTGVSQRYLAGHDRGHGEQPIMSDPSNDDEVDRPAEGNNRDERGMGAVSTANDEIGTPQNVSNEDLQSGHDLPGTDLGAASGDRNSGAS